MHEIYIEKKNSAFSEYVHGYVRNKFIFTKKPLENIPGKTKA
jgi:hypothetical protein